MVSVSIAQTLFVISTSCETTKQQKNPKKYGRKQPEQMQKVFPRKVESPYIYQNKNNRYFNRKVKDLISYFIQLLY